MLSSLALHNEAQSLLTAKKFLPENLKLVIYILMPISFSKTFESPTQAKKQLGNTFVRRQISLTSKYFGKMNYQVHLKKLINSSTIESI